MLERALEHLLPVFVLNQEARAQYLREACVARLKVGFLPPAKRALVRRILPGSFSSSELCCLTRMP